MTSPLIIPTLPVSQLNRAHQWPSLLSPTLQAEAEKNGWELISPPGNTVSLEHIGDDQSLDEAANIRIALLATHPSAGNYASPIEIMAAKQAIMIIFTSKPDSYNEMMEIAAQHLSKAESDIYYAVEFFNRENKLCHNAIVTATEAMQLLERMNGSISEEHKVSMTITSRFKSDDAQKMTLEERGLPDPNE